MITVTRACDQRIDMLRNRHPGLNSAKFFFGLILHWFVVFKEFATWVHKLPRDAEVCRLL